MAKSNTDDQMAVDPIPLRRKKSTKELKYFTRRWVLAYLLCVVRICQTALRQCIGMAVVCMTRRDMSDVTAAGQETLSLNATTEIPMNASKVCSV